jgi:hypothetical protein
MKYSRPIVILTGTLVSFLLGLGAVSAQGANNTGTPGALYGKIDSLDKLVFDAFNTRDTARFESMFSQGLEFFHDKGGLTGYSQTTGFLRKLAAEGSDLKRELVKGSMKVYPVPGYGAIQTGLHRFCHLEKGKQDCGTFKFVHIWKNSGDQWQITRVVSYDH